MNDFINTTFLVAPGETIRDYIEAFGMTQEDFARRLGITRMSLSRLLKGESAITIDMAQRLSMITGTSPDFWVRLEANFALAKMREDREAKLSEEVKFIEQFPLADMIKRKFLPENQKKLEKREQVDNVLKFFQASTTDALRKCIEVQDFAAAARTTKGAESDVYGLSAYIQMGTRISQDRLASGAIPDYSVEVLKQKLHEVKRLSARLDEDNYTLKEYLCEVIKLLAEAGVVLVCMEKIRGVNKVNGIAKWVSNHPTIMLTLAQKHADRIIFSMFHEVGHILNDKKLVYVSKGEQTEEESAADSFAANALVASEDDRLIRIATPAQITSIARRHSVYSGIVAGRQAYLTKRWYRQPVQRSISWDELNGWVLDK